MNRSCSNKISYVFFSSRAAQNDNGRAQLFTECLQGKRIQRTRAPLLREKQKKKKKMVTIYTLTPSLGALPNVNLSSHYKMYLSETKN